jgi:hypothetical protein
MACMGFGEPSLVRMQHAACSGDSLYDLSVAKDENLGCWQVFEVYKPEDYRLSISRPVPHATLGNRKFLVRIEERFTIPKLIRNDFSLRTFSEG